MGDMGGGMSGAGLGLPPDDEDEEWKACNCESRDKGTKYDLTVGLAAGPYGDPSRSHGHTDAGSQAAIRGVGT